MSERIILEIEGEELDKKMYEVARKVEKVSPGDPILGYILIGVLRGIWEKSMKETLGDEEARKINAAVESLLVHSGSGVSLEYVRR
jgi:hypothetical protein